MIESNKIPAGATGVNLEVRLIGGAASTLQIDAVRIERLVETRFAYDANGNLLTETDALGHVTTSTYDELNRLTTTKSPPPNVIGPNANVTALLNQPWTTINYDGYGNVSSRVERRNTGNFQRTTAYEYDARHRRTAEVLDAGVDGMGYDGLPATLDYENQRTEFFYDAAGNLTGRFEYSESAAQSGAFDLQRTTNFSYDALNRRDYALTNFSVANPTSADSAVTWTTYDAAGNVIRIQENPSTTRLANLRPSSPTTRRVAGCRRRLPARWARLPRAAPRGSSTTPSGISWPRSTRWGGAA